MEMQHHAGGHGSRGQDPGEQGPSIPVPPHFASVLCFFAGCLNSGGARTERRLGESMVFSMAAMSLLRIDRFSSLASRWPRRVLVHLFSRPSTMVLLSFGGFHRHKPQATSHQSFLLKKQNQEKGWLFAKLCISWFILPPHSAMHNEKGKTPSTFPPSLASFSFFLPLKSLTRGEGWPGESITDEMRRSGVCDKIWKGRTQISAGKRIFLCCLFVSSSSSKFHLEARLCQPAKGSQWGGFNRPSPITITQSRRLPNLVIHISPARVPRSQTGGVV